MLDRRELLKYASAAAFSGLVGRPWHAAAAAPTRLLLVHGRGQQGSDPNALKASWITTLARGAASVGLTIPTGIDVAFPYYGDRLDEFTRNFQIPLTSDMQARGTQLDDEFLAFQAEIARQIQLGAGVTDDQVDDEYGNDPQPRGPLNLRWVQAILRAIDKHGPGINQKTLEAFTRDVFLYTTRAGVRDEINRIVAAQLSEEPTVIVGHSLGTVVAYSILSTDHRTLRVPLFVTLGSPLAVRAIRDQFRPLISPRPVTAWYNAFDTRDAVALYPLDATNFPVQPAIENYGGVKNSTDNRHGIVGYLDDPTVAQRILGPFRS